MKNKYAIDLIKKTINILSEIELTSSFEKQKNQKLVSTLKFGVNLHISLSSLNELIELNKQLRGMLVGCRFEVDLLAKECGVPLPEDILNKYFEEQSSYEKHCISEVIKTTQEALFLKAFTKVSKALTNSCLGFSAVGTTYLILNTSFNISPIYAAVYSAIALSWFVPNINNLSGIAKVIHNKIEENYPNFTQNIEKFSKALTHYYPL